jgi:hypothetical protein
MEIGNEESGSGSPGLSWAYSVRVGILLHIPEHAVRIIANRASILVGEY